MIYWRYILKDREHFIRNWSKTTCIAHNANADRQTDTHFVNLTLSNYFLSKWCLRLPSIAMIYQSQSFLPTDICLERKQIWAGLFWLNKLSLLRRWIKHLGRSPKMVLLISEWDICNQSCSLTIFYGNSLFIMQISLFET